MPTFAISRECDPALSLQEREMMTIQLIIGSSFMPSVRWIRSYAIERPGSARFRLRVRSADEEHPRDVLSLLARPVYRDQGSA